MEGALDDYLLKPITARQFEERLQVVLERKQAFRPVFQAIEAADTMPFEIYRQEYTSPARLGRPRLSPTSPVTA